MIHHTLFTYQIHHNLYKLWRFVRLIETDGYIWDEFTVDGGSTAHPGIAGSCRQATYAIRLIVEDENELVVFTLKYSEQLAEAIRHAS